MFCSHCGTSLADGSQFCVDCGHTLEGSSELAATTASDAACSKCGQALQSEARFCSRCGAAVPVATASVSAGTSAAAPAVAYEREPWASRKGRARGKLWFLLAVVIASAGIIWLTTTDNALFPLIKQNLTTAHAETISDGSVAIKPHGFTTYKINVPEGAIDVNITGQFDASGRNEDDVEAYVLTEAEFVFWQGGYSTSPFYDSGKVARAEIQASLPSRPGSYYMVFSNRPSRIEKTIHVNAVLRYDTWLPDDVIQLRDKVRGWFE